MRGGSKGELLSRGCICAGVGDLWGFFPLGRIESIVPCFGEASGGASLVGGLCLWRLEVGAFSYLSLRKFLRSLSFFLGGIGKIG